LAPFRIASTSDWPALFPGRFFSFPGENSLFEREFSNSDFRSIRKSRVVTGEEPWIVPIPGTIKQDCLEEHVTAGKIELKPRTARNRRL
jgi:hypothetical protein